MQVKFDKKTGVLLSVIALLAVSVAALSISMLSKNDDQVHSGMMGGMDHSTMGKVLSSSDAMFLQMMIPHHQQAVIISEYALTNSKNEQILSIANKIKADQANEVAQMSKWLADDGLGTDPGHSMSAMAGMLSSDQLATLKKSKGSSFDTLFLNNMIEHHKGALQMVSMIENSKIASLRDFAVSITKAQQAEIDQMQEILGN